MNTDSNQPFKVLLALLKPYCKKVWMVLGLTVLATAFELVPYWLLFRAVDLVLSVGTSTSALIVDAVVGDELFKLAGIMAGILFLKYTLYSAAYALSHDVAYQLLAALRCDLVKRLVIAPLTWLQNYSSAHLKRTVLQDVEKLEIFIAHHTVEFLSAILSPTFAAVFLLWVDWRLALAALATLPIAVVSQVVLMRGLADGQKEYSAASAELNGSIVEYVRNMPVMKVFRQDVSSFHRIRDNLDSYYAIVTRMIGKTIPGWSVFMVLLGANIFVILPVSMMLLASGDISLSVILLTLMLGTGMLKPLFKVMRFSNEFQQVLQSTGRIAPFLNVEAEGGEMELKEINNVSVTIEKLSFSYGDSSVLNDVSLIFPAGKMTAIVGRSGAGKSTISNLLGGLLQAATGEILLGETPLRSLRAEVRARLISVASQEAFLFKGSLKENMLLGRPDATNDDLARAVQTAQAAELVASLPDGYDTIVGERGTRLSGGEKQRIAIARALLADTPVLVLDEATAFADSLTEHAFYTDLQIAYPGKTLIVIAHRLYSIKNAEQIIVMDKGSVKAAGKHAELKKSCNLYAELWGSQFDSQGWVLREQEVARV